MRPTSFELLRPETLDEAVSLLSMHAPDVRALAGGQSLIPMMKLRLASPERLVDLTRIADLSGISTTADGTLVIGALTTHDDVANSSVAAERVPVLVETATHIADMQVRNRGTMGGSCCQHLAESDYPPVLTALDAQFEILGAGGTRSVPAEDFFVSALITAVGDGELLTSIRVPALPPRTGGAHEKVTRRFNDFGLVSGGAVISLDEHGTTTSVRIVLGNAGPRPMRARSVEEALTGHVLTDQAIARASTKVLQDIEPADDNHASADYRRRIAPALVERIVRTAHDRAKGAQ